MLVHGAGGNSRSLRELRHQLARVGWSIWAPTLRGHGPGRTRVPTTIEELASQLARQMVGGYPEPEPVVLIGHSMGSLVALQLAADHPEWIRGLVLVGASGSMTVHPALLETAFNDHSRAAAMLAERGFGTGAATDARGAALRRRIAEDLASTRPGVIHAGLTACHHFRGTGVARRITGPALVLNGADDRITTPQAGRKLAASLPDGLFRMVERAGHFPTEERPRRVAELIRLWVPD